jgi:4-hydroxy-tetrahydrodipicolinate reductase
MGSLLIDLASQDRRFKIIGATERAGHPLVGRILTGGAPVTSRLEELLPKTDVVIDFTSVKATLSHAKACAKTRVRMVIGTTGWDARTHAQLKRILKKVPYVISPNMSLAVNLLFRLAAEAGRSLPTYDAEIVEVHHNQKKDAPSGTALRLAEELNKARGGRLKPLFGRHGRPGARRTTELGILAVRVGDAAGDHTLILGGPGERLELTHRAHSRETFARGALEAAAWIKVKRPGTYDMQDVLGLRRKPS